MGTGAPGVGGGSDASPARGITSPGIEATHWAVLNSSESLWDLRLRSDGEESGERRLWPLGLSDRSEKRAEGSHKASDSSRVESQIAFLYDNGINGLGRITAVYVMCLSVCSSSGPTVEQITSRIRSARLDPATLEALPGESGPETAAMSKEPATESAALLQVQPPAPKPLYESPQPPSAEEQAKMLDEVRHYAINYSHRLPDFICLELTRRYIDTTGWEAWRLLDVLAARLSYFNQKEEYRLISQNGRVVKEASYASADGAFSMGDFGTEMREIFDPDSHARFAWKRSATLRGRLTYVFSYQVPLEFSRYTIAYKGEYDVQRIKVAYRGSVFVDKELNTIVRIAREAQNIPPSFPIHQAEQTLDYDFVKIGDGEFFLPLVANLRMRSRGGVWTKNVKEFRLYQKFSSDAVIKFDGRELTPLPDVEITEP